MNKNTGISIFNSLTRKLEPLTLNDAGELNMFVCGPTVYDYIHIGNARTFTIFDAFARFLRFKGIKLNYIQNITDIDDKIINKANDLKISPEELSEKFTQAFIDDMTSIKAISSNNLIKATDKIPQIIAQVQKLIDKGNAYLIDNDGYYFDLTTFPDYGKLSKRTIQMAEDGTSRIDENMHKRNQGDFCLWKFKKDENEPSWQSPFGEGRPGWHIEDTAITESVFGPQYDIHGGGQDLIFPHHEAEIAQQESASGLSPFVKYWMHCAFLVNKEEKMSKSKGNFTTLRELIKNYSSEVIRYYFLSAHYRSPLSFDKTTMNSAEGGVERISNFMQRLHNFDAQDQISLASDRNFKNEFNKALSEDFNTPKALSVIFDFIKETNIAINNNNLNISQKNKSIEFMDCIDSILGIVPKNNKELPQDVQELIEKRLQAKLAKNFQKSDELRTKIESLGYSIKDTKEGQILSQE